MSEILTERGSEITCYGHDGRRMMRFGSQSLYSNLFASASTTRSEWSARSAERVSWLSGPPGSVRTPVMP